MAKILVADDNSNIQKMVILALKDQGIEVVAVGNGEAAVRKTSDLKPDLVLADIFMPVRNGYEVCKYVKDDPKLSHIPVILLVGAFDPLDEQEAQRVGADGVLKKPFVPPDPLISMVKSALARAGVSLGAQASATPPPPPPMPAAKKLEPVPMAPPKIVPPTPAFSLPAEDEFPAPAAASQPSPFKFDKGTQPLAFGSLLDTETQDDEAVFAVSPQTNVAPDRNWGSASAVEEEEDVEEDSKHNSWRASSLPEVAEETPAGQTDWREAAFSVTGSGLDTGIGTEKSNHAGWAPSIEKHSLSITEEEAAMQAREREKFASITAPHGQEDWAKAIREVLPEIPAIAQEDHISNAAELPKVADTPVPAPPSLTPAASIPETVFASEPEQLQSKPDVNSWMAGALSPWEAELQRASQLTATWQSASLTPAPAALVDERLADEAPLGEAPVGEVSATEAFLNSGLMSAPHSVYEDTVADDQTAEQPEEEEPLEVEELAEESPEPVIAEQAFAKEELVFAQEPVVFAEEPVAGKPDVVSVSTIGSLLTEETQEILHEEAAQALAEEPPAVIEKLDTALAASSEPPAASVTDMDEIVAKVLARMNPEVLQAVTREILKPLVEAMINDEIRKK